MSKHNVNQAMLNSDFSWLQHLDYERVHTERTGELIAYYKIARNGFPFPYLL